MSRGRTDALAALMAEAWEGPAWHGPALRQVVASLTPELAVVRPRGASHSPWGLLLHAAYWKHRVWCRLAGRHGERFPRRPSNFPAPPTRPEAARWHEDVTLLEEMHARLTALVATLDDRQLDERRGKDTVEASLRGIALHDLYHAGQMRMLERLGTRRPTPAARRSG